MPTKLCVCQTVLHVFIYTATHVLFENTIENDVYYIKLLSIRIKSWSFTLSVCTV
jgi:hypothetical protein